MTRDTVFPWFDEHISYVAVGRVALKNKKHRVWKVPTTDQASRVCTSAATT
jgi:protein subunit release factor A